MTPYDDGRRHTGLHEREEYTSDQLIQLGTGLARAMNDPAVNIALRSTQQNILAEIHDTEPHEAKKREAFYAELRALNRVVWMFTQLINQGRALERGYLDEERMRMQEERRLEEQQAPYMQAG